jgi:hypothetical protein
MRVRAGKAEAPQQPLPLMISSLEILMVPQPQVSPHTQGCKHNRGKSQVDKLLANRPIALGSYLFGTSAIFPRAGVSHICLELRHCHAAAAATAAAATA